MTNDEILEQFMHSSIRALSDLFEGARGARCAVVLMVSDGETNRYASNVTDASARELLEGMIEQMDAGNHTTREPMEGPWDGPLL